MHQPGGWAWSLEHRQACRIVEAQDLWGEAFYRVWVPSTDVVVCLRGDRLHPTWDSVPSTAAGISYLAAAARVADAMTQDVLLAPIESSVIPLPHQIRVLSRAVADDRVRYLLADEVGLGKTIEAGLIMRELKLRGLVKRTLVVAPKGLVTQWVSEMQFRFNERFQLILSEDLATFRRVVGQGGKLSTGDDDHQPVFGMAGGGSGRSASSPWELFDQVVVPVDSVKPMEKRRGWSAERAAEFNQQRFGDLIAAGWDLVIVDEAHRLGGSTEQVARYKLGRGLAEAAPYLLLLSATPHQGKTDAFHRLISLLDADAFPEAADVSRERVGPYVIRTEKRRAIDAQGTALFKPRETRLVPIAWGQDRQDQRSLYEAVTEYVRVSYNQALQEKRNYIGFLMILMQRLVTSSTRAIRTSLERRLEVLKAPDEQLYLFPMSPVDDEWHELDGQEQMEKLLASRLKGMKNERAEVKLLLEAARRSEAAGPDAKAEALLERIYRLQQEEGDPDLKILIFTEFVPTQEMLREFLTERGFPVVCLNGSMGMQERAAVQEAFATEARVLVSTDAGGEGLNLQFCHVVVNYDLPWNPMRLEQRIGRVDRIGQEHTVRAVNFVLEDTVEHRVREVMQEKLAVILEDFGVDKTSDVLDSASAEEMFDDLYIEAILNPEDIEATAETLADRVREEAQAAQANTSILGDGDALDPTEAQKLMTHPLPHWVEGMITSYVKANGGKAERDGTAWQLTWPGETAHQTVVFTLQDAERCPSATHLTLEDTRVHGLVKRLPRFAVGQPIACIRLPELPADVAGLWSLWRVGLQAQSEMRNRVLGLFVHDDGRLLVPTARFIWDQLLAPTPEVTGYLSHEDAVVAFSRSRDAAEVQGKSAYEGLVQDHQRRVERDREKGEYAFAARRRAVRRIGLPAVRDRRLARLSEEERRWREGLAETATVSPELVPMLVVRVTGGACDE